MKADVRTFSERLTAELSALDWQARNELLISIGNSEIRMRSLGQQERPVWRGPLPEVQLLGRDVVATTDQGERRGRVICFGLTDVGAEFERTVVIHVPSSGTHHQVPGSLVRVAGPDDRSRIQEEVEMARRLNTATVRLQDPTPRVDRPKVRGKKDPGLIAEMLSLARADAALTVDEAATNFKITGVDGRRMYIFRSQLRVDLSGFSLDHPGVRRISDEEAREMHLGRVRGQLLFGDRDVTLDAFKRCLDVMANSDCKG